LKGFAEVVKEKRQKLGLTTSELARNLGVPEEIVLAIEKGAFLPPSFFLPVLVKVLKDDDGQLRKAYQNEAMRCFSFG